MGGESPSPGAQRVRAVEPQEQRLIWDSTFPPPTRPCAPGRRVRSDSSRPSCRRSRRRPRAYWPRVRVTSRGTVGSPRTKEMLISRQNDVTPEGFAKESTSSSKTERTSVQLDHFTRLSLLPKTGSMWLGNLYIYC
uniref:Uncharacterized protein n=1 Tax=Mus musculus TaxID=10090 RepID=Q3UXQ5_MOUSE|nr:unnamed protein product [Mus musculus]